MRAVIGFLVLLALVIFLLSNRDAVALQYWPFGLVVSLPLGAVVLVVLFLGFFAGLLSQLPARLAAQRRAKRAEKRNAQLQAQAAVAPLPAEAVGTTAGIAVPMV